MTQTEAILRLLVERGERGITALDAITLDPDQGGGSLRLAARIWDLRSAGHKIVTRNERHGRKGRHARYILRPEPVLWSETELRLAHGDR
jgi:Helix-turn-helix domain